MEVVSKIKDEQLTKLQEFRNFFTNANMALGETTLNYEAAKKAILSQVDQKDLEFNEFRAELEKEYGKVNINISNGEFQVIPEEQVEDQKPV
jgi:hypothetical protein